MVYIYLTHFFKNSLYTAALQIVNGSLISMMELFNHTVIDADAVGLANSLMPSDGSLNHGQETSQPDSLGSAYGCVWGCLTRKINTINNYF